MIRICAPRINPNDEEVGVVLWHATDGDYVEAGGALVDVETTKTVVTVEAESAGFVRRIAKEGDIVRVGEAICDLFASAEELSDSAETRISGKGSDARPAQAGAAGLHSGTRFSHEAAQLVRDLGLSESDFRGSGLVTARSIRRSRKAPAAEGAPELGVRRAPLDVEDAGAATRRERISLSKRAEIRALSIGESGSINSTLSICFDSAAIRARLRQERSFDGNLQPLILYELTRLLKQWPQFTGYFEAGAVHYHDRIDLGLAVDLGSGVRVITIRNADTLTPLELFERTIDFGMRYMENQLRPDELVGSSVTVTDLSGFDVLYFKPLINGRQSAIIGVGGDSARPGHPMSLNITFDHRVASGREAATFLRELRLRIMSYAPAVTSESGADASVELNKGQDGSGPGRVERCDSCGIDQETYRQSFGRAAYLVACFNHEGRLVGVCHRCYGGWI